MLVDWLIGLVMELKCQIDDNEHSEGFIHYLNQLINLLTKSLPALLTLYVKSVTDKK